MENQINPINTNDKLINNKRSNKYFNQDEEISENSALDFT